MRTAAALSLLLCSIAGAQPTGELMKHDEPLLSNVRQLILEGARSGEGYFAADGKSMVFQSEREPGNPFYQIYTLDLETGDTTRISPGSGKTTCGYIRPGHNDQVLFGSTHLDADTLKNQKDELDFRASGKSRRYAWDYDNAMDVFVSEAGQLKRLTDAPGYDAEASYSPDGSKIVFCSLRDAFPLDKLSADQKKLFEQDPAAFGEIYIMNADGTGQTRLTNEPGYDGGPFFSPDGKRIIWRRFDKTGINADVYTMKIDGSDVRRITDFKSMSWAPMFHPSGKYIVFTTNKHGFSNFELFIVDPLGTKEPVRVTYTNGFDGLPCFSPDGTKLAWTTGRTPGGKSQIFMADWDDAGALKALGDAPQRGTAPTSAPAASAVPPALTAPAPKVDLQRVKADVAFLASDKLEGRLTGSNGAVLAAGYIGDELAKVKALQSVGDGETFYQQFDFPSGTKAVEGSNRLAIADKPAFTIEKDFRPLSFSDDADVTAPVVFAGYGMVTPAGDKPGDGYNSYAGLDVKDKIVLALRYVPEAADPAARQTLNRYASLRYKALQAREHGAKALLIVTGPNSPHAGELIADQTDAAAGSSGIPVVAITADVAKQLLGDRDLKGIQDLLDKMDPHATPTTAPSDVTVRVQTKLERRRKPDANIVAVLPPTTGDAANAEYIVVGAHYDHLGRGDASNSLARGAEAGQICYGADDNASGTSIVLELARTIAADARPRTRGVVFAFWSGEEMGLLGSAHYVEKPAGVPSLEKVAAYVNFDMVGRLRENKLSLQGTGSSSVWKKLIERRNVAAGFALSLQDDPYLPTDSTSFYTRGVPTLAFFTGSHEDYHRPTDKADTLNYDGMARVATFARSVVMDLVNAPQRPDYVKVERTSPGGSRDAMRIYIGSIPDYASEIVGVKLNGARGGSPAEKAGLQAGDVIVEFGTQKIANIYDYTYALDAARVGVPMPVVVMRNGERVTLSVTPEARK